MKLIDSRAPFPGRFHSHGDRGGSDPMDNKNVAHETSDIYMPAILWSAAIVAATCIGTGILILFLFKAFETRAEARDPKLSPLAVPATKMPETTNASPEFGGAPEPRLLTSEPTYLRNQRLQWEQQLHGYGWVDQQAGVARIPIDKAKELVKDRGLPVRPDPVTDPRLGTHAPAYGESSSGRTVTKK